MFRCLRSDNENRFLCKHIGPEFCGTNPGSAFSGQGDFAQNPGIVGLAEVAKVLDEIANGDFVVVLPKKQKNGGKSEFEIVGFENGCRADAGNITNEPASDDGDGWSVVVTEKAARKSKIFLFNTDAATTEAAVAALYS